MMVLNLLDQHQQKVYCKIQTVQERREKGEKKYQPGQRILDEQGLQKYILEISVKNEAKFNQFEVFEHTSHPLNSIEDEYYNRDIVSISQQTFYHLGRNILISLLDIWNKNPFSRIKDLNADRKEIADRQAKLDRFRKQQAGIKAKQKRIVQLIQQQFYDQWHRRNVFNHVPNVPQRDKKRNHTLQVQRIGLFKNIKAEKGKSEKGGLKIEEIKQSKVLSSDLQIQKTDSQKKTQEKCASSNPDQLGPSANEALTDNRIYYSKNFKVGRGKQTSSANQGEKETCRVPSIQKELLATQIKVALEEDVLREQKNQNLSLSSKIIKNTGFNINMRVRNVMVNGIGGFAAHRRP